MSSTDDSPRCFPESPVLLVDDEEHFLASAEFVLHAAGIDNLRLCRDGAEVLPILSRQEVSLILLDLHMPGLSGRDLLPRLTAEYPHVPVVVITAQRDLRTVVECMKNGAFDYVVKPVDPSHLTALVRHAIDLNQAQQENRRLKQALFSDKLERPHAFQDIVTGDRVMQTIFRYVEAIAASPLPVLITGESGTGKELIARALHQTGGHRGEFVAVNIAGFDDNLFSDSLFGHRRGAFTGADRERHGLIEQARSGILFLDEIGELSMPSQVKLLRLLQEKQYYPLGADSPLSAECRVVVATNRDLSQLIASGQFRKDLFYRLQTHHIHLPPLRERLHDLPLLIGHFLEKGCRILNKPPMSVPPELMTTLSAWPFPGNVRELESLVMDALSRSVGRTLSLRAVRERTFPGTVGSADSSAPETRFNPDAGENGIHFPTVFPSLAELESAYFAEAMKRAGQNQTLAARLTGLKRKTFGYRWQLQRSGQKKQSGPA